MKFVYHTVFVYHIISVYISFNSSKWDQKQCWIKPQEVTKSLVYNWHDRPFVWSWYWLVRVTECSPSPVIAACNQSPDPLGTCVMCHMTCLTPRGCHLTQSCDRPTERLTTEKIILKANFIGILLDRGHNVILRELGMAKVTLLTVTKKRSTHRFLILSSDYFYGLKLTQS